MVRRKRQFIDFGFDPGESSHHFAVIITDKNQDEIIIEERFEWENEAEIANANAKSPVVKVRLDRYRWKRIAEVIREQFNKKIRAAGHRSVAWKTNQRVSSLTSLPTGPVWSRRNAGGSIRLLTPLLPGKTWERTGVGERLSKLLSRKTPSRRCPASGSWRSRNQSYCLRKTKLTR